MTALVVLLAAAYVWGLAGGAGRGAASAIEPADPPQPTQPTVVPGADGRIVMTGTGEARGVPDQLHFRLSVHTQDADVSGALEQANSTMRRVQQTLGEGGVADKDVATTGLDIQPQYDDDSGSRTITGYQVSEDLGVLVRSLPDAGGLISAAVDAGGNAVRMHDLRLRIGDADALLRKARQEAVADATTKAKQYADATGQRLGDVLRITEVGTDQPGPRPINGLRASDAAEATAVPIEPGRATRTVRVSVEWALASTG